jgi:hypothetical protein
MNYYKFFLWHYKNNCIDLSILENVALVHPTFLTTENHH